MYTNQQLKDRNLPHCDWRTFLVFRPSTEMPSIPQKDMEALDAYFIHFLPANEGKCWKCGAQQGQDGIVDLILKRGRFRFGLRHGEGKCITGGCNWPARAIHYDVGPFKKLEFILQYHPDVVTWDE